MGQVMRKMLKETYLNHFYSGVDVKITPQKHQAVGFDEGLKRANEKITNSIQFHKIPTIALENILFQQDQHWFDLSVLVLKDSHRQIVLHTFTQTTPIPLEKFLKQAEKEMPVYSKECDSKEKVLSAYLQVFFRTPILNGTITRQRKCCQYYLILVPVYWQHFASPQSSF